MLSMMVELMPRSVKFIQNIEVVMKILANLVVASALVGIGFSAVASDSAGYVEPGYVNYNYEVKSKELSISDINQLNRVEPSASSGNGIKEAGYLNYSYTTRPAVNPAKSFDENNFKPFYSNYR
jgi:hypothetical protein